MGILQTRIFAASADHWWSKPDKILVDLVNKYLQDRLLIKSTLDCKYLNSYVARMCQSESKIKKHSMNANLSIYTFDSLSKHCIRLKPTAWLDLVKHTGILIPNWMPHQYKSNEFFHTSNSQLINAFNPVGFSNFNFNF